MAGSPPVRQQWPQIATHGQFQIEELSRSISRAPQQARGPAVFYGDANAWRRTLLVAGNADLVTGSRPWIMPKFR